MQTLATEVSRTKRSQRDPFIRCASRLFREQGYAPTTTRQLAQEMGLQKSTLYHYFQKKEDILLEISQRALRSITDSVQRVIENDDVGLEPKSAALTVIERAITAHLVDALEDLDLHAVMLMELRALSPRNRAAVIELRKDYELLWEALIERGVEKGALRSDISARHLTLALLNLLNWTIFWYRPDGPLSAEQWASTVSSIFFSGVTPGPGARGQVAFG